LLGLVVVAEDVGDMEQRLNLLRYLCAINRSEEIEGSSMSFGASAQHNPHGEGEKYDYYNKDEPQD